MHPILPTHPSTCQAPTHPPTFMPCLPPPPPHTHTLLHRLHDVAAAFDDSALLELAGQHCSSLQRLSLSACKGISWKGVVGLKVGVRGEAVVPFQGSWGNFHVRWCLLGCNSGSPASPVCWGWGGVEAVLGGVMTPVACACRTCQQPPFHGLIWTSVLCSAVPCFVMPHAVSCCRCCLA
jgi:hypothetical protein